MNFIRLLFVCSAVSILVLSGCETGFAPGKTQLTGAPASGALRMLLDLESTYQARDYDRFRDLFPTAADELDFVFTRENGESWNQEEWLRIHRRLFDPESVPPGDTPVPAELWLQTLTLDLTPRRKFVERTDLYAPAGPLDPIHWRAWEIECRSVLFFEMQGETDYTVDGKARLILAEDRSGLNLRTRFVFYRIEELAQTNESAVEPAAWSSILGLYR